MTAIDALALRDALSSTTRERLEQVESFAEIDSTNNYLKDQPAPLPGRFRVAIADHQTAGRGRRSNRWLSQPGASLCLSVAYTFERNPEHLPGLTLALGVAIAESLAGIGVERIALKWPNDLLVGFSKLGGILTESVVREHVSVIAGVGVNLRVPAGLEGVDRSGWAHGVTGLESQLEEMPGMHRLAALVTDAAVGCVGVFEADGLAPYVNDYGRMHLLKGRTVVVDTPDGVKTGVVTGIDDAGALLVESAAATERIVTGSIVQIRDDAVAV